VTHDLIQFAGAFGRPVGQAMRLSRSLMAEIVATRSCDQGGTGLRLAIVTSSSSMTARSAWTACRRSERLLKMPE
jgi:hypothetical protein